MSLPLAPMLPRTAYPAEVTFTARERVALEAVPWHLYSGARRLGNLAWQTISLAGEDDRREVVALLLRAAADLPPHVPTPLGVPGSCCDDRTPAAEHVLAVALRVAQAGQ